MQKRKLEFKNLAVELLQRGQFQPRVHFDEETLSELAQSIKSNGLIQPIVVRPLTDAGGFEIVAGERRWRAAQLAGMDFVPCLVSDYTDEQAAEAATIENINRVDLNPIEEAKAYQRLIDEFKYGHEEVAAAVGKSRTKITNSLRLLKLDIRVQELLTSGALSEGHGKMLASLTPSQQFELAKQCVMRGWNVRKIEQEVKKLQTQKANSGQRKSADVKAWEKAAAEEIGCGVNLDLERGKLEIDYYGDLNILDGIFSKLKTMVTEKG